MARTRVAIVGLGAAARTIHLPALRKVRDVDIVGGHDPAGGVDGIAHFASVEALLAETTPDILVIATPPAAHLALVRAGLAAGCHIFCEKPLANTLAEADAIVAEARAARRYVLVNSEFPYMPIHAQAQKLIGSDRFGRLLFVEARQSFVVTPATEAGWRGSDPQRSFKEFGTHVLDLCSFFFGEQPAALRARMPRAGDAGGPDYLNLVQLEFSGDRVAQIVLDRLTRGRHAYLEMRLVGEHATIETSIGGRLNVTAGLHAQTRRPFAAVDVAMGGSARLYRGERHETIARAPLDLFVDATARLFTAFLDAIAAGREPPATIEQARRTLAMLYGAYAAAEDGATLTLG